MISRLYAVVSWLLIALGAWHMALTPRLYHELAMPALWFFSGGMLIALSAAMNLVNRAYGATALGLRRTVIGANLAVALFAVFGGVVGRAPIWELAVILGLYAAIVILSCMPGAIRQGGMVPPKGPSPF